MRPDLVWEDHAALIGRARAEAGQAFAYRSTSATTGATAAGCLMRTLIRPRSTAPRRAARWRPRYTLIERLWSSMQHNRPGT